MKKPKTAIIHDWLTGMRGGEKCLEVFCELFPEATIFTLVHNKGSVSPAIEKMDIRTSFLQKIPGISGNYRSYLPFFPAAVRGFDLSGYDLVLSSSHCAAKGAKKDEGALHICYCYTPMRYAWTFFDEYFSNEGAFKKWAISRIMDRLKKWDIRSNDGVDHFVAISDNIKNRIKEIYDRDSEVIYPPADVYNDGKYDQSFNTPQGDDEYYLIVSALAPYKRVDLAVSAFNENGRRLIVVGKGTDLERLEKMSERNIEFRGWASDEDLIGYYSGCRALIFPGIEDFGIVPVEAQAYGKPVIAYAEGGALETVVPFDSSAHMERREHATGVFFHEQTSAALNGAIRTFEENKDAFKPENVRENALRFNRDRFKQEIENYIQEKWTTHARSTEQK